jgi:predicted unusual protein kinase regulating ubiquinone biosynthesis (AarF/ABC1/UbiB family)
VPDVVWERTTRRVLALEDVTAIKITDSEALRAAGIDPALVAPVFASVMFDQLFTNGFFHADPHPGNIFVTPDTGPSAERAWKLTFIDFGMMGEVSAGTRSGLRKLLIAAASRDGKGLDDRDQRCGGVDALGRHSRAGAGNDAALCPVRRDGLRRASRCGPAGVP